MALFGLGSGLGQGLGALAQGYQQGQIKGQAVAQQKSLQEQDRKYRQALLDARIAELTAKKHEPTLDQKTGSALYEKLYTNLHDPAQQDFWNQNPRLRSATESSLSHLQDVIHGTADLHYQALSPVEGAHDSGLGDEALGGGAPPPTGGLGATADQVRQAAADAGLGATAEQVRAAAPPGNPPPSLFAPSNAGAVRKEAGLGPGPLPFQLPEAPQPPPLSFQPAPPGTPVPAPKPAPAAAQKPPETSLARYIRLASNPPTTEQRPGERPKDFEARQTQEYGRWKQQVDIAGKVPIQTARGIILTENAAANPDIIQANLGAKRAGAEASRATAAMNRALTPVRVESGKATAAKARTETTLAPRRVAAQETSAAAAAKNAATGAGRLAEETRYHNQQLDRAQRVASEKSTSTADARDREIVSANLRIQTATIQRTGGGARYQFDDTNRASAQKAMEQALTRIDQRRQNAAAGERSSGGSSSGPARPSNVDAQTWDVVGRRQKDWKKFISHWPQGHPTRAALEQANAAYHAR